MFCFICAEERLRRWEPTKQYGPIWSSPYFWNIGDGKGQLWISWENENNFLELNTNATYTSDVVGWLGLPSPERRIGLVVLNQKSQCGPVRSSPHTKGKFAIVVPCKFCSSSTFCSSLSNTYERALAELTAKLKQSYFPSNWHMQVNNKLILSGEFFRFEATIEKWDVFTN